MARNVWKKSLECEYKRCIEWLTVQLADNSEEITNLEREIDKFEKDPNTSTERLDTLQQLLQFKRKQRLFNYNQNNMKSLLPSHHLIYVTSKKHSDVT